MFTRADIAPLSIAAVTAVGAGLGLGAWAGPPAHVARPAFSGDLQPILADDPNLALYKQVIAEQGGPGPLYVVAAYAPPPAPSAAIPEESALEAQVARDTAAFDAQNRAWEAQRSAWLETLNAQRPAPSALPVAYAEPEAATTEAAPSEPLPEAAVAPG